MTPPHLLPRTVHRLPARATEVPAPRYPDRHLTGLGFLHLYVIVVIITVMGVLLATAQLPEWARGAFGVTMFALAVRGLLVLGRVTR